MENTMKMYITADEVAELLGVSRGYAYKVIRGLNDELKAKGFRVISGKVPRKYFQEKFYGMAEALGNGGNLDTRLYETMAVQMANMSADITAAVKQLGEDA